MRALEKICIGAVLASAFFYFGCQTTTTHIQRREDPSPVLQKHSVAAYDITINQKPVQGESSVDDLVKAAQENIAYGEFRRNYAAYGEAIMSNLRQNKFDAVLITYSMGVRG